MKKQLAVIMDKHDKQYAVINQLARSVVILIRKNEKLLSV